MIYTSTKSKRKPKMTAVRKANILASAALEKKWGIDKSKPIISLTSNSKPLPFIDTHTIPSKEDGFGICSKKEPLMYSGQNVVGIATMHKSCLQPVFSQQEAEDSAHMRR